MSSRPERVAQYKLTRQHHTPQIVRLKPRRTPREVQYMIYFLLCRTKNFCPTGLQIVVYCSCRKKEPKTVALGGGVQTVEPVLFFLKKEPKTLALRGFKSLNQNEP
jgi:hypothetical protein